jgi:hypothetical protein
MSEQENTRVVQKAYENFKSGDIPGLLDLYSDDIDWRLPRIESMPFFGPRRGREETAEFFRSLGEAQDVLTFNPREFVAQGDKVVALGDYSWRVKATGREFGSDWVHVWTVTDGKLSGFQEYTDTAAASKAHQKAVGA